MSLLLPAVAMMLGWGLRGFIGGGPLGAMIPVGIAFIIMAIAVTWMTRRAATHNAP